MALVGKIKSKNWGDPVFWPGAVRLGSVLEKFELGLS